MAHIQSFKNTSDDTLDKLRESGCSELFIGLESGSPKIIDMIRKTSDAQTIIHTLTHLFKAGINIKGYFIMGFPDETENDLELTYNMASTIKELSARYSARFRVSVFQFRPYHGTAIYNYILSTQGSVPQIEQSDDLSAHIGRRQFNFSSGNFGDCSDATLFHYLKAMDDLNRR